MVIKKQYKDINDTLKHIKIQIVDSLDYAKNDCPQLSTPQDCFYWLKGKTIYKSDPKGIELLQTLPTLMEKNFHKISGAGDCDCFTICIVALLIANGIDNIKIVLVGRQRNCPVHIYCVVYQNGKRIILDLTNKKPNQERPYPYIQELPVNWRKW